MSFDFDLATNLTLSPASALVDNQETVLWTSAEVTQGSSEHSVKVNVTYDNMLPDPTVAAQGKLVAVLEQKQSDNTWEEIGRQNQAYQAPEQGNKREIIVTPSIAKEEGVDDVIAGMEGEPVKLKSFFNDEATGALRVVIYVKDSDSSSVNAFQSVDVSVSGTRYV